MHVSTVVSIHLIVDNVAQAVIHPQLLDMAAIESSLSSDNPSVFALRCLPSDSGKMTACATLSTMKWIDITVLTCMYCCSALS